jgi:O-antigen/teichoic acid export membrane protein
MIGLPITIGYIFNGWLINGPLVMYRYFVQTDNHLGQLALAMQVLMLLGNLMMLAFSASLPLISRSVAREDGKDIYFADAMIRFGIILGAMAGIAAFGAGEWIVGIFFGNKFHEAGYLLGFVLWLLIPTMCGNAIWSVYMARGKYILPTMIEGAGALIFTAIFPWIVNKIGAPGAVVSAGIGLSCSASILIFIFGGSGVLNLRRVLVYPFACVAIALGVYFALNLLNASVWVCLPACYAVFISCIFIFGIITPSERFALVGAIKRKFNK